MTFHFIEVPKKIDTSRKLMPKRDEKDQDWFYGIDPAWLGEVLTMWKTMGGYPHPASKKKMPEYPAVSEYHNWLRAQATSIKGRGYLFYESVPTEPFETFDDLEPVEFDDVPANVEVGDPLRKTDIMDMFDWMKGVKAIERDSMWADDWSMTYRSTHDEEGYDVDYPLPAPTGLTIYRWWWDYLETNGPFQNTNGGRWRRDIGTAQLRVRVPNTQLSWFKGYKVFAICYGTDDGEQAQPMFIPSSNVTAQQSGSDIIINATISGERAKAALDMPEKEYKTEMETTWNEDHTVYTTTGSNVVAITVSTSQCVCFFELADQYRHPET